MSSPPWRISVGGARAVTSTAPLAILVGGAGGLRVAAQKYFEVVAVVEAARVGGHFPRPIEVGRAVDVDDAADAGNHFRVGGGGRHLRTADRPSSTSRSPSMPKAPA